MNVVVFFSVLSEKTVHFLPGSVHKLTVRLLSFPVIALARVDEIVVF
jgi:hypothetical protein